MKIQKAIFTSEIRDKLEGFERVYFGNEFCERLIPSQKILRQWREHCDKAGKNFTFVTPYVTNTGLAKLGPLFGYLEACGNSEVVFNDWGVFHYLRGHYKGLTPVMGRLLNKQRRDPRGLDILLDIKKTSILRIKNDEKIIVNSKSITPEMFRHFQGSVVNAPIFQNFLLENGVRRIELDNLSWKMRTSVPTDIGVSMYVPYGYISTTRKCGFISMSHDPCNSECKKFYSRFYFKTQKISLLGAGNSMFYRLKPPSNFQLKRLGVDRVVFQPRLPF